MAAHNVVAGFGDPTGTHGRAARSLGRNKPQERHQMASVLEACHVADLGDDANRNDEGHPAQGLQRLHQRGHRPSRQNLADLLIEFSAPSDGLRLGAKVVLEGDLLGRMTEALVGKPFAMLPAPRLLDIASVVFEQERLDTLASFSNVERCRLARTNEVANGFVNLIRHPIELEFACPQQSGEHQRIARVVLDPIARSLRCPRRGNHSACLPELLQVAMKTIAARAGFLHKFDASLTAGDPPNKSVDRINRVRNRSKRSHFTAASGLGDRNRDTIFVHIQSDKSAKLFHGPSSCA